MASDKQVACAEQGHEAMRDDENHVAADEPAVDTHAFALRDRDGYCVVVRALT